MFMNKAHLVQQKNNVAQEPIAVSPLQSERSEDKERVREREKKQLIEYARSRRPQQK